MTGSSSTTYFFLSLYHLYTKYINLPIVIKKESSPTNEECNPINTNTIIKINVLILLSVYSLTTIYLDFIKIRKNVLA